MEPISTFNLGASRALQNKSFELKGLADRTRQLLGPENRLQVKRPGEAEDASTDKELMEVARKFEAILINQMLKAMRKTVNKSGLLDSFSLQQYESMMDEEIANEMVKQKGIGLADSLFYQLSRLEKKSNSSVPFSNNILKVNAYEGSIP